MLFQVYINDISKLDLASNIVLYAVLYYNDPDLSVLFATVQNDLGLMFKRMNFNKLTVNINKSKYMLVGTPTMLSKSRRYTYNSLNIGGTPLDPVDSYN